MKIFETVKSLLLEGLEEAPDECPLAEELPYYLFARRPFTSHEPAREALVELGAQRCIAVVRRYYPKSPYDITRKSLPNFCEVANILVFIMGRELLYRLYDGKRYYTRDEWDMPAYRLGINTLEEMLVMAQQWAEESPEGLLDIWETLLAEARAACQGLCVRCLAGKKENIKPLYISIS